MLGQMIPLYIKKICEIPDDIVNVAESLKSEQKTVAISTTVPRSDNFEGEIIEVNELLALKCREKGIPTIMTVLIVLFL